MAPIKQTVEAAVAPIKQTVEAAVAPIKQTVEAAVAPIKQTVEAEEGGAGGEERELYSTCTSTQMGLYTFYTDTARKGHFLSRTVELT